MKILLTGATGQVGHELERSLQVLGEVVAPGRALLDLGDLDQLRTVIRAMRPQLIVNAAAYTNVTLAETQGALAHRINALAPGLMAAEGRRLGAPLVHFSTDYVFDGGKAGPYLETDQTNPLNSYGASKLAGERAIAESGAAHLILRASWVYGLRGNNFLTTMLQLARERHELRVVSDQHGAPTWSRTIADCTAAVLLQARTGGQAWWERHGGIYHMSAGGQTSWYGFTKAILARSGLACQVIPISTAEYGGAARRPANSMLNTDKLTSRFCAIPAWDTALQLCLNGYAQKR
ncbi:dTDP-4-dehydrorhamnose reductase [Massilia sp. PAMC28688]|uniref:dTDP-4-dehydrorhamnose reductase n=1 Tax=Massilia sp. PAMC28688 TaxID=2861283 RepID=UPI001C628880|nr:dTDP-4-dehydrorhamnose reductase [Massilia sp. PAMC28688]QYF91635.1 dTDP-4-dehydrorhamnose reductase [Massilia sp. PAMC28688]